MINRGQINTDVDRPDPALAAMLEGFDVATLHEAHKTIGGWSLLPPLFHCVPDDAACIGVAVTALLPEGDNLGTHRLLSVTQPGDVMVMTSVQSSGWTGMCGELLAICAKARGVKGIVANGSTRDLQELRGLGLPIWYRRVNAIGMLQRTIAGLNVPIAVDGVVVRPGALVVADSDGVLMLEPSDVPEIVERAQGRRANEEKMRPLLEAGETPYDIREKAQGASSPM